MFCSKRKIDPLHPPQFQLINFLAEDNKITSTKSALGWILCINHSKMLDHQDFTKILSSRAFKPLKEKTCEYVWDPQMIVDYWSNRPHNNDLSLMELMQKVTTLLLLCSGRRPGEIRSLSLNSMVKTPLKFMFTLPVHTKTSRAHVPEDREFPVRRFRSNPRVCPYETLENYINRTQNDRQTDKLLVTANGKFTPVSGMTVSRWTRIVMENAGINTDLFKPYSTRSATASKLAAKTGSLDRVLELGKWRSTSAFFQHYLRRVKYLMRDGTTSTTRENKAIPASPVRKAAAFSLKRSLQCKRDRCLRTPLLDLKPKHQGYLPFRSRDNSTETGQSSVQVFNKQSELQNFSGGTDILSPVLPPPDNHGKQIAPPVHHPVPSVIRQLSPVRDEVSVGNTSHDIGILLDVNTEANVDLTDSTVQKHVLVIPKEDATLMQPIIPIAGIDRDIIVAPEDSPQHLPDEMGDVVTIVSDTNLECSEDMPPSPSVESESLLNELATKTDDEIAKMDCHFDGKNFTVIMPEDSDLNNKKNADSKILMPPPKNLKIAPKIHNDKLIFASGGKVSISPNARHSTMELPFVNNLKDTKLKATYLCLDAPLRDLIVLFKYKDTVYSVCAHSVKSICVFHNYRGYFVSDCSAATARKLANILYRSSLFPADRPMEHIEVSATVSEKCRKYYVTNR